MQTRPECKTIGQSVCCLRSFVDRPSDQPLAHSYWLSGSLCNHFTFDLALVLCPASIGMLVLRYPATVSFGIFPEFYA